MATRIPVVIELADGTQHRVTVDQRDFAAAEAKDLYAGTPKQVIRTRFLAWSALTRDGGTKAPWEKFNASDCVSAEVDPEWSAADPPADDLDPGSPDQSGDA